VLIAALGRDAWKEGWNVMGCTTAANNQGISPKVAKYRFNRKEIKSGINK
jgi:hypothetical protein